MSLTDTLRFAYVCPLAWEKLTQRSATARHCDTCAKTVTDLSGMPRSEADAFLASQSDAVCVRIARDAAGRSLHVPSLAGLATVAALAGCMAPGGDTGDTAADTGDTAADTGDTATPGDATGDEARSGTGRRAHRPVGTGLGVGEPGDAAQADPARTGDVEAASGDVLADGALDTLLSAASALVMPPEDPEPVYITMGVMARFEPTPKPAPKPPR